MDNFTLDIIAEGRTSLEGVFVLAFRHNGAGGKVSHYSVREPKDGVKSPDGNGWCYNQHPRPRRIIFFWGRPESSQEDATALPFTLDAAGAADFAARWLDHADYGREPDHDGDNGKGWRAYVEGWGHVDGSHYAVIAVAPAWAMYGK